MAETFIRYGVEWDSCISDLQIELLGIKNLMMEEDGWLGPDEHFWNVVQILWGPDSACPFYRTPWAERMIAELFRNKYLGLAGCASSGKSGVCALYGIVRFMACPYGTKVFMTSTSLKQSAGRIWGQAMKFWQALPKELRIGKLSRSQGTIHFVNEHGDVNPLCGLELIACERKQEKQAMEKFIGFKNDQVIMIADELPELTESILEASISNLSSNPYNQFVGLGNPASYYDPFGKFCEPVEGWNSINETMDEWQSRYGLVIRFDAEKSPNVVAGETIYEFLPTLEQIEEKRRMLGTSSPSYWRMVRGYWSPTGAEDAVFSEAEIELHHAKEPALWREAPTPVAAIDPAFTSGGDRIPLLFGHVGIGKETGEWIVEAGERLILHTDTTNPLPHTTQIAIRLKQECESRGVKPENVGIDATGAGSAFCDAVAEKWSNSVLRVPFNGAAPEDRNVSNSDPVPCNVRYENRVTYLWFTMVTLLREGKLRGLDSAVCKELVARRYSTKKPRPHERDSLGVCFEVEPKAKMKSRKGESPDLADAQAILCAVAMERFGLMPHVKMAEGAGLQSQWREFVSRQDSLYESFNLSIPA